METPKNMNVLSPQEPTVCADVRTGITPPQYHTPSSVRQQRLNSTRSASVSPPQARPVGVRRLSHTLVYHTPLFITSPNTPCGCSDVLSHTLVYHTPTFITPPNVPCGRSDVLSHPLAYHTPWGPPRPALYHRGYTRYHTPHRIPHPVIIFPSAQMYHHWCVILCSLR